MLVPHPSFRANPSRSIEIFGVFDDALANRVLGRIAALRAAPNQKEPITVYINSDGGDIRVLEIIDGALNCKDQDGFVSPVITVACGNASSAAADLLAYGDYAIAYPHSSIYFHGVRLGEVKQTTVERALSITEYLRRDNLKISHRLARAMVTRLIHRYAILRDKFKRRKKGISDIHLVELECFVEAISERITDQTETIVREALHHVKNARALTGPVFTKAKIDGIKNPLVQDSKILCALIKYEVSEQAKSKSKMRLNEEGVAAIINDYLVLRDYHLGSHQDGLRNLVLEFGAEFLSDSEFKQFLKIPADKKDERESFLKARAGARVDPFWYFTVILCRNLLRGENSLSPHDAYWIGAIDEVVAISHGERLRHEQKQTDTPATPAIPAPAASPSAPVPPS